MSNTKTKVYKNKDNTPPERKYLAAGALTAPLPPALVTVGEGEDENVLTVAWTGILATQPPKTYISVRPSRHSYEILKKHGEFVLHLASAEMAKAVDYAGIYTGAKVNKFEKCGFTRVKSECVGAPTVAECPVALECRVTEIRPLGSHEMFMADIVAVTVDDSLLSADGKLHLERAGLLAYAHGDYFALGRRVGSFGFSAVKHKKNKKPRGQREK